MLVEEIVRLERAAVGILLDEKDRRQLFQKLHDPQQKVDEWDLRNICYNTLHGRSTLRVYETPALFVVLPSDLDFWDDIDPSTHQFRPHFMCDNQK